ncbi:MAG TPA: pyruvate ferredoxin oxidoreductase [Desulfobacteraceae bacterium]|nr:indolepyruvate oxidoreductase subunit beta [Deltaproteobacteria bacterium]HDI60471.1 pyruvate ferredoxin oxidoreductase [Desulfobacteraceae bacterium]
METKRLIIVAVGGQGNLLAAKVLGEAALSAGIPVHMSEIHGMAQRGGVVESALVFGEARSTIISDGEADAVVGFEPLETLRALNRCNRKTTVITNLAPLAPFTVAIGRGTYPDIALIQEKIRAKVGRLVALDAVALARSAGSVLAVNIVLLGALIRAGILPLTAEAVRDTIRHRTKAAFVEANLKAFDLGFNHAAEKAV